MKKIFLLGLLGCAFLGGQLSWAEELADAGDLYLRGYQLVTEAQKTEAHDKTDVALKSYQQALQIFSSVAHDYPDWNPDVVQFRLNWLRNKISHLQNGAEPEAVPAAPHSDQPAATVPIPADPRTSRDPFLDLLHRGIQDSQMNAARRAQLEALLRVQLERQRQLQPEPPPLPKASPSPSPTPPAPSLLSPESGS